MLVTRVMVHQLALVRVEEVFALIKEAGAKGIITTELRKKVTFGNSLLAEALEALRLANRIEYKLEGSNIKRYFVTSSSLVVV